MQPSPELPQQFQVDEASAGDRLDAYLAKQLPVFSRATLRKAIDSGAVTVDGKSRKASFRVREGWVVCVSPFEIPHEGPKPQPIALDILFEDDDLIVVNKPPGMVVHPAKGHWEGTLASALAHHFGQLSTTGGATRPGIVHRLDRDTSGVMVIAKHNQAHERLAEQFQSRTVTKRYLAITLGVPDREEDIVTKAIGPHPHYRERMALRDDHPDSRAAETRFRVLERFRGFSLIECLPKTGRTHQIRLHLAHLRCPVLCDKLYGGRSQITAGELSGGAADQQVVLARQALHAASLEVHQPQTGERLCFSAEPPADMLAVLELLRNRPAGL